MGAIVDPAATAAAAASVQHVTKRSSDELLRKFAELGEEEEEEEAELAKQSWKRRRSCSRKMAVVVRRAAADDDEEGCESPSQLVVERRSLLPVTAPRKKWRGGGRGSRGGIKNKKFILMDTIEKAWRKALEGASRVILEKQYGNRHRRLISDVAVY
ncbi:unnamed protein product [Linum tenue]|uniref:Uncharacterized protein n=1 Tax=Linum tenue TaxID=586396 RepID=A0AAV0JA62_9ROSI|nr:unnamed protein product [Linum tenue]